MLGANVFGTKGSLSKDRVYPHAPALRLAFVKAMSWTRTRPVGTIIKWHPAEFLARIGFVVTTTRLSAGKAITVLNVRAEIENRLQ